MRTPLAMTLLVLTACTRPNPFLERCGNGLHEPQIGEECDEGEANADDGACTLECKLPSCGDGLLQAGEACDLGEMNGAAAICTPDCQYARCGDGYVEAGAEVCDNGDILNKAEYDGDGGCSTTCVRLPNCGDGVASAPYENCDDGNRDDGDGCSHLCQKALCGDGNVDLGEACDDGNKVDTDACLSNCTLAACGDGFVHEGEEECDDANDDNNDACLSVCIAAVCGDGLLREGVEECDDGNRVADDGCDNACVRDRLVFLTEEIFAPKAIGDIDGADLECRQVAIAFNHPTPSAFKAWISNGAQSPATRFYRSPGRYVLITGEVVAESWDDLTDGTLKHAINRTLDGKLLPDNPVWTSTRPDGESWGDGHHCMNWSTSDSEIYGRGGIAGYADSLWTDIASEIPCGGIGSFYCFEQF